MSVEANKTAFRRFVDEAGNKGDLTCIDEIFASDVDYHLLGGSVIHGPQGVKGLVVALRTAFPDMNVRIEELVGEGETVVARVSPSGTNTGPFIGNPATGKRAAWSVVHISHFIDGKIVENRVTFDQLGLLEQLGLAPGSA